MIIVPFSSDERYTYIFRSVKHKIHMFSVIVRFLCFGFVLLSERLVVISIDLEI